MIKGRRVKGSQRGCEVRFCDVRVGAKEGTGYIVGEEERQ